LPLFNNRLSFISSKYLVCTFDQIYYHICVQTVGKTPAFIESNQMCSDSLSNVKASTYAKHIMRKEVDIAYKIDSRLEIGT